MYDDDDVIPTLWHKTLPAPFIIRILAAYDMMEQSISLGTTTSSFNSSIPLSVEVGCTRFPFCIITRKETYMFSIYMAMKN
jgi:hypothetical protein